MRKLLQVLLVLFTFVVVTQSTYAFQLTQPSSISYGSTETFTIEETSSNEIATGNEYELRACGGKVRASETSNQLYKDIKIPGDFPCDLGKHTVKIWELYGENSKVDTVGPFTVTPKNMQNPHSGKYLFIEIDKDDNTVRLRNFLLTNDASTWNNFNQPDPVSLGNKPAIAVEENDWRGLSSGAPDGKDDYGKFIPPKGTIIKPSYGPLSDEINWFDKNTKHHDAAQVITNDGKGTTWLMNNIGFGETTVWNQGREANYGCTLWEKDFSTCSPVHRNGEYRPQGEIIVARAPRTEDKWKNYKFHICREGNYGRKVAGPSNTYVCDQNTNDWVLLTECTDNIDNDGDGMIDYDGGTGNTYSEPYGTLNGIPLDKDVEAGCYGPEDTTEGCYPGTPTKPGDVKDVDGDGFNEQCVKASKIKGVIDNVGTLYVEKAPGPVRYRNKYNGFTAINPAVNTNPGRVNPDKAVWESYGKVEKVSSAALSWDHLLLSKNTYEEHASTTDEGSIKSDIPQKAAVYQCIRLRRGKKLVNMAGPNYPEIFKGCSTSGTYTAVFNGTNHGFKAVAPPSGSYNALVREGPHRISISQAVYDYQASESAFPSQLCKDVDGDGTLEPQKNFINCNDKAPHGWTAVNSGEPQGNKDMTGQVDWKSLRKNYHYGSDTNVVNWSQDYKDIPSIPNKVGFTGGWIGNCQSGREWRYNDRINKWVCGSTQKTPTVLVNFSRVTKTKSIRKKGYSIKLKIEPGQIKKINKALNGAGFPNVYWQGQCWIGGQDTMPASQRDGITFFRKQLKKGKTNSVVLSLPPRKDAKMGDKNTWNTNGNLVTVDMHDYSCTWGFYNQKGKWFIGTPRQFNSKKGESFTFKSGSKPHKGQYQPGTTLTEPLIDFWTTKSLNLNFGNTHPITSQNGYKRKCTNAPANKKPPVCKKIVS